MDDMKWEKHALEQFNHMIAKVPELIRPIAQKQVLLKIQSKINSDDQREIIEKDVVDAFFAATPFGFHGPMKADMVSLGINFVQYGYEK